MAKAMDQQQLLIQLARLDEEIRARILWARIFGKEHVQADIDALRGRRQELEDQLHSAPIQAGVMPQLAPELLQLAG